MRINTSAEKHGISSTLLLIRSIYRVECVLIVFRYFRHTLIYFYF